MAEKTRVAETPDKDPRKDMADTSLTVDVDADVSAASDAIESLQTDVEALTEELNEAAERVEDISLSDTDYGLPAPSPSDVQERVEQTGEGEMVPAEPLYELAELWASVPAPDSDSYGNGRKEAGEWLKEELDQLTDGETDA
jgi:hypothetical protein